MSSAEARKHVLCTGIAVLDLVFRVGSFPRPDVKTQASEFRTINGGNAANAIIAGNSINLIASATMVRLGLRSGRHAAPHGTLPPRSLRFG